MLRNFLALSIWCTALFLGIFVSACGTEGDNTDQERESVSKSDWIGNQNAIISEKEGVKEEDFLSIQDQQELTLEVTSDFMPEGEYIPNRHTCNAEDVSPHLKWSGAPDGTKSFAIVFDDPDTPFAPPFVHWVVYGIPSTVTEFEENMPPTEILTSGGKHGVNDFGNLGYGGPCPPGAGKVHTWVFKVYALDIKVDLAPGATKAELLDVISDHILAQGELARQYRSSHAGGQAKKQVIKNAVAIVV